MPDKKEMARSQENLKIKKPDRNGNTKVQTKTPPPRKAIEAHSQKTAAEAKKIKEIKIELSKLDNELATDVALLRKQIDSACCSIFSVESKANKKNLESVDFLFVSKNVHDSRRYQSLCWNLGALTDTSNPLRRNKKIMTFIDCQNCSLLGAHSRAGKTQLGCLPFGVKNRRNAWDFPTKPEGFKLGGLLYHRKRGFEKLDQNASDEEPDVTTNMLASAQFA